MLIMNIASFSAALADMFDANATTLEVADIRAGPSIRLLGDSG